MFWHLTVRSTDAEGERHTRVLLGAVRAWLTGCVAAFSVGFARLSLILPLLRAGRLGRPGTLAWCAPFSGGGGDSRRSVLVSHC